ncbi:MAG: iron-sulfur cluster assembly protein [Candidatus Planktophila sp.]|jgi:metal-sulfur cluster biosynthetic enzyme
MSTTSMNLEEVIRTAAGSVPDPEIRKTMGELGLIDEVEMGEGGNVIIRYHLTSPLCPSPFAISIGKEMRRRVEQIEGVNRCTVELRDHFIAKDIASKVNEEVIAKDAPAWL